MVPPAPNDKGHVEQATPSQLKDGPVSTEADLKDPVVWFSDSRRLSLAAGCNAGRRFARPCAHALPRPDAPGGDCLASFRGPRRCKYLSHGNQTSAPAAV